MATCPYCGYWIKNAIFSASCSHMEGWCAVYQCPNGHTWREQVEKCREKHGDKQKLWFIGEVKAYKHLTITESRDKT